MPTFGKEYYDEIWGTVHRHDYCVGLAEHLVRRYGRCRILDVGTGCGFLVHLLREMGCEAWGLDVSAYATENSCAPGYVLRGTVTDIPFKDGFFQVVHSQGMWDYVEEVDIERGWSECQRVGLHQVHTVDPLGSAVGEKDFVTARPLEWWDARLSQPKILIACPVHERKEYGFQRWIDNVKKFTYPHVEIFVADTTEHAGFSARYSGQVHIVRVGGGWGWQHVARAMDKIREHFLAGNYPYWFNVESDILPPAHCIETMLEWGRGADWIAHCFPRRIGDHTKDFDQGIGCSMLSRPMVQEFTWGETIDTPDSRLWEQVRPKNKYKVLEMWGLFNCVHLVE